MGQIIAVVSGKGGTGKTSLCAGIASGLAKEGSRVLCIDADMGLRNLDISLGMTELAVIPFTEYLRGAYDMESISEHPRIPGLFLMTAPITEAPESIDLQQFAVFLNTIRQRFDFCLIDAPAGVGIGFQLACTSADRVLVVSGCDPASLRDAASVARRLCDMPEGAVKLLVNRVIPKMFTKMSITIDDLMDGAGLPLIGLVPEDSGVTLAAASSTPLLLYKQRRAAQACRNIAKRLQGKSVPLMKIY